jgi:hypothetical protein
MRQFSKFELKSDCYALNCEKKIFEDEPIFVFFTIQRIRKNILHSTMEKQVMGNCEILKVFGAIYSWLVSF